MCNEIIHALVNTRMHSSRMRTGRSLTVCCSLLPGGGSPCRGGSPWSRGVLPGLGGFLPAGGQFPWSQGGLLGLGGSPCWGVCLVWGGLPGPRWGVCLPGPGGLSAWSWGGSACLFLGGCLPGPGWVWYPSMH